MITNEENILIMQALNKLKENPSYHLTEEELEAFIGWMARKIMFDAIDAIDTIQTDGLPRGELTITLDAQSEYVQKKIRRHATELTEAWPEECFDIALERCGLGKNLILPAVVRRCLIELLVHHDLFRQFFDSYTAEYISQQPSNMPPQEYDPNALTVNQMAAALGLTLVAPNTKRGQYFGQMVGGDYRVALIKFRTDGAIKLPFKYLAEGQRRPVVGDNVKMKFSNEVLVVNVLERQRWR